MTIDGVFCKNNSKCPIKCIGFIKLKLKFVQDVGQRFYKVVA